VEIATVFGLDDRIASLSGGTSVLLVVLAAVLLGLRHATDPDHLAAVTTLIASGKERARRNAAKLGIFWGLGHAVTLFAFGLPIVLFNRYLPDRAQEAAETVVAVVIVVLAVRLLYRWRAGYFHAHPHEHEGERHVHLHAHDREAGHAHRHRSRTPLGAFGIGLVHGIGGSAGVGILIVATIQSQALAVASLTLLAIFTAVSMALLTTGFGFTLSSMPVRSSLNAVVPTLGVVSLGFGIWYGLAALGFAPYYF
jgi:ABC-type nickel/cobalt efflux system permease component RcnA